LALLSHFFPPKDLSPTPSILPPFKDLPPLHYEEISFVLSKSSNSSAPVAYRIPYSVWKAVNKSCPTILVSLLSPCVLFGYYPLSLKKDNHIILSKSGKSDYTTPASFPIMVLLQTVSKILKRITTTRLSPLASSVRFLNQNQYGSLRG